MRLPLQILSWIMLVLSVLATASLVVQSVPGSGGNSWGIAISLGWVAQNVLALKYIKETK